MKSLVNFKFMNTYSRIELVSTRVRQDHSNSTTNVTITDNLSATIFTEMKYQ